MRGLTLVEVLIAMGISVVVGVLLLAVIVNSSGLFYSQSSKVGQGVGVNDALSKIRSTIKESAGIVPAYAFESTTYTTGATQLVLKLPSLDGSGNIISDTFDHFIFFPDQTKLRFKSFPHSLSIRKMQDQILSLNVDSIKFQYFDSATPPNEVAPTTAAKVRISLSLKQKTGQSFEVSIATSEASLRND